MHQSVEVMVRAMYNTTCLFREQDFSIAHNAFYDLLAIIVIILQSKIDNTGYIV